MRTCAVSLRLGWRTEMHRPGGSVAGYSLSMSRTCEGRLFPGHGEGGFNRGANLNESSQTYLNDVAQLFNCVKGRVIVYRLMKEVRSIFLPIFEYLNRRAMA